MNLPYFHTHICLVSEQVLPNLLPILDKQAQPKRVIMMVTPSMRTNADRLATLLHDRGVETLRVAVDAYGFETMRQSVFKVVAELDDLDKVALNLTGGTKIMAFGAFDIAREHNLPVIYLDSREQRLLLFSSTAPYEMSRPVPDLLTVKTALAAQGYSIHRSPQQQVRPEHRPLFEELVKNCEKFSKGLSALNSAASKVKQNQTLMVSDQSYNSVKDFDQLLDLFQQAGALIVDRGTIIFKDEPSRLFCNGGWLEEYVLLITRELKQQGHILNLEPNVEVKTADGIKNEIDLAFTATNKLHLIECKTAQQHVQGKELKNQSRATETGYKLDTLRDLTGGLFGKAMLVSYMNIPDYDLKRLNSYNIKVVQTRRLAFLREELLLWLRNSR